MVYYYKKKIPSIDDIVIAKVQKISEYGIDVTLTEYNDIHGFINCGEVSRKKKVNLNKLLTVGKDILLNVIQADESKKLIDLSKRTISDEDIKIFGEKHKLHIQLYNIFKYIFMKIKNIENPEQINNEEIHNYMCWSLFKIQSEPNYDDELIIDKILSKDTNLEILNLINWNENEYSCDNFKNILDEYINNKINRIKPEKIETIKLMTYSSFGLADIKYVLNFMSFKEYNDLINDFDIEINYKTGSVYSINIKQKKFDIIGTNTIDDVMFILKKEIKKRAIEKQMQNQIII